MVDILLDAGARKAQLVDEPLAAAVGAGLDVTQAYGTMVLDVGGGTADLAVLSLGRVIVGNTVKIAGDRFDEAITRYVRRKHNLMIGERTAEELKITIGAAMTRGDKLTMEATGRSLITGLPKTISLGSDEMVEALDEPLQEFIENVHALLERTPPELAADIFERSITMTGGASQLFGFDQYITKYLKVSCRVAEDPEGCVAIGMGRMLEDKDALAACSARGREDKKLRAACGGRIRARCALCCVREKRTLMPPPVFRRIRLSQRPYCSLFCRALSIYSFRCG